MTDRRTEHPGANVKGRLARRRIRKQGAAAWAALALAGCATGPGPRADDRAFAACPAFGPAYAVTDQFMTTFNSKNAEEWVKVFHLPSVRIASGNVRLITSAEDLAPGFDRLVAEGWDRSDWASRRVVQCGPEKAHMLTTFVRYRKDGSELSRFDSLYIVEFKNGRWGLTARSSFAP
jgi:hypothetical protein